MKTVFAPGCALMIYKPNLEKKILQALNIELGDVDSHLTCCRHEPKLEKGTTIINTCPGCDRRYRQLYDGISTISLWEVLANSSNFPFPDYQGRKMSILDACPTRKEERVHQAVRMLLKRMHIDVIEPENTQRKALAVGIAFMEFYPLMK